MWGSLAGLIATHESSSSSSPLSPWGWSDCRLCTWGADLASAPREVEYFIPFALWSYKKRFAPRFALVKRGVSCPCCFSAVTLAMNGLKKGTDVRIFMLVKKVTRLSWREAALMALQNLCCSPHEKNPSQMQMKRGPASTINTVTLPIHRQCKGKRVGMDMKLHF